MLQHLIWELEMEMHLREILRGIKALEWSAFIPLFQTLWNKCAVKCSVRTQTLVLGFQLHNSNSGSDDLGPPFETSFPGYLPTAAQNGAPYDATEYPDLLRHSLEIWGMGIWPYWTRDAISWIHTRIMIWACNPMSEEVEWHDILWLGAHATASSRPLSQNGGLKISWL